MEDEKNAVVTGMPEATATVAELDKQIIAVRREIVVLTDRMNELKRARASLFLQSKTGFSIGDHVLLPVKGNWGTKTHVCRIVWEDGNLYYRVVNSDGSISGRRYYLYPNNYHNMRPVPEAE